MLFKLLPLKGQHLSLVEENKTFGRLKNNGIYNKYLAYLM